MTDNSHLSHKNIPDTLIDNIKKKTSWSLVSHIELWLCDYVVDPLMFFLPIAIGLVIVFQPFITWIAPLIILTIFIYFLHYRQGNRVKEMERKLVTLTDENSMLNAKNLQLDEDLATSIQDMRSLCEGYLYAIAEGPLKFCESEGSHERITLYAHDSSGQFFSIGRYSRQPDYRKPGRSSYPEDQGVISRTWKNGDNFTKDYPDRKQDPCGYHERCKKDGLSEDVINELGMPSRLYYGYRISNTQGREPIAVLITESTNPERYTEIFLENLFKGKEQEYLRDLTERLSKWMPNLKEAKDRGF